jgi:hypothetical protein
MRAATFRRIALSLPEAEERETWGEATFRVRNRIFAMLGSEGKRASVKSTKDEQQALIAGNPETFYPPPYVGAHGWVGVQIGSADAAELEELLVEAWRLTAPKRLVKAFDEEHG